MLLHAGIYVGPAYAFIAMQLLRNTDLFETGGDESDSEGECSNVRPPPVLPSSPPQAKGRRKKASREPHKEKKVSLVEMEDK